MKADHLVSRGQLETKVSGVSARVSRSSLGLCQRRGLIPAVMSVLKQLTHSKILKFKDGRFSFGFKTLFKLYLFFIYYLCLVIN